MSFVLALLLIGVLARWSRARSERESVTGGLVLAVFALPVLLLTGRL